MQRSLARIYGPFYLGSDVFDGLNRRWNSCAADGKVLADISFDSMTQD